MLGSCGRFVEHQVFNLIVGAEGRGSLGFLDSFLDPLVGASLLAIAVAQSMKMLDVPASSRASSLPPGMRRMQGNTVTISMTAI
ncbi:hypothetical protein CEQ51_02520 [Pseudomonas thivervalensis]|uniref:Uncharacterized protein n=1 Tax=Pseudomonas thivervalensis TaxID=86265 RepID=A0A176NID9_9PSED|nr:hypothetical protein CE140_03205 [Pseudomonas thivervalensis]AXA58988.1 hypothetical protein CEQ51_02520 [Pseudomonas thivervalensis]OAB50888.1 hypothetical protein APS14_07565 [Pseudomonas thivervalensis]